MHKVKSTDFYPFSFPGRPKITPENFQTHVRISEHKWRRTGSFKTATVFVEFWGEKLKWSIQALFLPNLADACDILTGRTQYVRRGLLRLTSYIISVASIGVGPWSKRLCTVCCQSRWIRHSVRFAGFPVARDTSALQLSCLSLRVSSSAIENVASYWPISNVFFVSKLVAT